MSIFRRHTVLAFVLTLAFQGPACRSDRKNTARPSASEAVAPAVNATAPEGGRRPVYRHSVIPGGVYSSYELTAALQAEPAVARHYEGFIRPAMRMTANPSDRKVFVSYRIGNKIFWTRNRLLLPKGELLLSDGFHEARARCGNRISLAAQRPVAPEGEEPAETEFDEPEASKQSLAATRSEPETPGTAEPAAPPQGAADENPAGEDDAPSSGPGSTPQTGSPGQGVLFAAPLAPILAGGRGSRPSTGNTKGGTAGGVTGNAPPGAPPTLYGSLPPTLPIDPPIQIGVGGPASGGPTLRPPSGPPLAFQPPSTPVNHLPPGVPPALPPGGAPPGGPPPNGAPPYPGPSGPTGPSVSGGPGGGPPGTPPTTPPLSPPATPPVSPPTTPYDPSGPKGGDSPDKPVVVTPEPGTGLLAGCAMLVALGWRHARKRKSR